MAHLIDKDALVAEIEKRIEKHRMVVSTCRKEEHEYFKGMLTAEETLFLFLDTLEVKKVDINKLCEFRENIGFAYPDGASEYQKQLACYRQGIKDVIKAQKGEEV